MGLDDRFKHIGHFRLLFLSGDSTPPNGSHRPWRFPFGGSSRQCRPCGPDSHSAGTQCKRPVVA